MSPRLKFRKFVQFTRREIRSRHAAVRPMSINEFPASSDAWLGRFDVSPQALLLARAAVLETPRLLPSA
jgi:hypothetical protein